MEFVESKLSYVIIPFKRVQDRGVRGQDNITCKGVEGIEQKIHVHIR